MPPSTKILDHIVHLSPEHTTDGPLNEFKELGFTVIPGGTHTGGETSNVLVILKDGVYLELLIFNSPNRSPSHHWGTRRPGWIDAADLGTDEHLAEVINGRYAGGSGEGLYKAQQPGGRLTKTPEGEERELKWRITIADERAAKGELPFFCEDLTPREWRVPTSPASNMVHPNGALGIATLTYVTPSSNLKAFSEQLTAVFGSQPFTKMAYGYEVLSWSLHAPHPIVVGDKTLPAEFHLRAADSSDEGEEARGTGLYEVALWVSGGTKSDGEVAKNKYGKIRFVSAGGTS